VASGQVELFKITRLALRSTLGLGDQYNDLKALTAHNAEVAVLSKMTMFAALTDAERGQMVSAFEKVVQPAGTTIISQGEEGEYFYVIREGSVKVIQQKEGDEEPVVLAPHLGPGDYFGEMALLDSAPRMASVVANRETVTMQLGRSTFTTLLGAASDVLSRGAKKRQKAADNYVKPPDPEDLKAVKHLGEGQFGQVTMVVNNVDGKPYAAKVMGKIAVIEQQQVEHVESERKMLSLCDHPFITRILTSYQTKNDLIIILELAPGGELWAELYEVHEGEGIPTSSARFYAGCVASALAHMHEEGIAYRDLKPENLLIDAEGYLKVVDFGFAKLLTETETRTWTICGTPEYLAPEIIACKGHSFPVDWWAYGCLLFEMCTGGTPFADADGNPMQIFKNIILNDGNYLENENLMKSTKDLVKKLLVNEPALRLGSLKLGPRDILSNFFFDSISFKELEERRISPPMVPDVSLNFTERQPDLDLKLDKEEFDPTMFIGFQVLGK